MHFARLCELLYEKNSELPDDDPLKAYKGRAVVLGNQMKDESFDYAQFQDQGSAPPVMEAVRAAEALSLIEGYCQKESDAESAYTQAFLKGTPTFVYPT